MPPKRALIAGMTDFTGVSLADVRLYLDDWREMTSEVVETLGELRKRVVVLGDQIDGSDHVLGYLDRFVDLLTRYAAELSRLSSEMAVCVTNSHVLAVRQLYAGSLEADESCSRFKSNYITKGAHSEDGRWVVDRIYADTRDMLNSYRDLSNLAPRLEALVGSAPLHAPHLDDSHTKDESTMPNPETAGVLRILFLASNPATTERLALDEEARDIRNKIRASEYRDRLALETRWAVRPDDLLQALNEVKPVVVHFSGHGAGAGGLILVSDKGGATPVSADALRRLFQALGDSVRVVVLNACYSEEQAAAIADVVDCVVGMNDSVADEAARVFAASFYRALGFGASVDNAFQQGVAALALGNHQEDTPVLRCRVGVRAEDVVLFPAAPTNP